jgi:hypothetical protein
MKDNLVKKCLTIGIILFFIGTNIIPSIARSTPIHTNTAPCQGDFFGVQSNVNISWDRNETTEPIIPRGELRQVPLNISYWTSWGRYGRLISYLCRYYSIPMKVSLEETPDWAVASLSQEQLSFILLPKENTPQSVWTQLSVQVAEDAPAYESFNITVHATIDTIHGLFGFLPLIRGRTSTVNLTFTVGYRPVLKIELPEGNTIETPPGVQVQLPIGITNLGNGKTIVQNQVVACPSDWNCTLQPQLVLNISEYKEIMINVTAPAGFSGEKTITMGFTPHSYENYSEMGEISYITLLVYYNRQ